MNKKSKHNRIYKNKSKKYFGGNKKNYYEPQVEEEKKDENDSKEYKNDNEQEENNESTPSQGIFDIIGNKVADYSGDVAGYVNEKALRLVGLQPITSGEENNSSNEKFDNVVTGLSSKALSVGNSFVNVINKTAGALIGQINGILESPKANQTVIQAANDTVRDLTKLLNEFNKTTSNPEFKAALDLSLNNAADYANILVEATNEPVNNAIDNLRNSAIKASSGVVSGIVKVATDAAAAVPGAGAIIDVGKMINDGTAAIGKIVEAGSETTETLADVLEKTSKNFKQGIDKLNSIRSKADSKISEIGDFKKLTKDKFNISKRINSSIDNFENPLKKDDSAVAGGGYKAKTKKKVFKHKVKSKRVRFAI